MNEIGEKLNLAKSIIEEVLEMMRAVSKSRVPEDKMRDLMTRIQLAKNSLIQNEKKIWIRTKVGKEILSDFNAASEKLLGVVEKLQRVHEIEPDLLVEVDVALGDVESHAKRLNEETRRRSMVVT